jgi:hypothetical protein
MNTTIVEKSGDANSCYAIGANATIMKTTDDGINFISSTLDNCQTLRRKLVISH